MPWYSAGTLQLCPSLEFFQHGSFHFRPSVAHLGRREKIVIALRDDASCPGARSLETELLIRTHDWLICKPAGHTQRDDELSAIAVIVYLSGLGCWISLHVEPGVF